MGVTASGHVAGLPTVAADTADGTSEDASLTHRARRGALWTGASAIVLRLSSVLVMVVVARIITPAELGVFALAIAVYGFVVCVGVWGVGAAIGRSDLDVDKLGPTVTTFSALSGCATAAVMALLAGPLASALGVPEATVPIRILAIVVALQGIFAVPVGQNQRQFRQDVVFRGDVMAFFGSNATLLLLVLVLPGAEAFAWSRVVGHVIVCLTITLALDKRYRPGWRAEYIVPLLRFGVPAALGWMLSQFVLNVDYVIIGREMSTVDLGLYMLAFNIASWPTAVFGAVVNQIVLPAFSAVNRDGGDLRQALSRAVQAVAFVACPIAAFTCAYAYPLIGTVYGGRWIAAAPVLSVLALYGVLYVLGILFDNIMIAAGRTATMFAVQAAALVALVPAMIVGVHMRGLVGVGVAHIVVVLGVTMPAYMVALHRITGSGIGVTLRALSRPVVAALAATGGALVVTHPIRSPIVTLFVALAVGAIVYLAVAGRALVQYLPRRVADQRLLVLATTWPQLLVGYLRPGSGHSEVPTAETSSTTANHGEWR
ncbi:MAG: oligosaccharide flippase family protein [Actinobacteria bacterium]|nr:oligosaccharide flippase family protein [Actinomycetota bacterium]